MTALRFVVLVNWLRKTHQVAIEFAREGMWMDDEDILDESPSDWVWWHRKGGQDFIFPPESVHLRLVLKQ